MARLLKTYLHSMYVQACLYYAICRLQDFPFYIFEKTIVRRFILPILFSYQCPNNALEKAIARKIFDDMWAKKTDVQ